MFAPKDSNVGNEFSAKHMAIGAHSDAISVTVEEEDDGGIDVEGRWRRRTRTLFDGRRSDSDEGRLEILGHPP